MIGQIPIVLHVEHSGDVWALWKSHKLKPHGSFKAFILTKFAQYSVRTNFWFYSTSISACTPIWRLPLYYVTSYHVMNTPYRTHCHRCLQPGHIAKHCEATTPARAHRGGSIATLTTEVRGLILTDLQIREKTYLFLVDMGAEVSLIPTSIASEIGLPIRHGCTRCPVMVDGTSIRCDGTANANVRLGQKQITRSFYVVPDI